MYDAPVHEQNQILSTILGGPKNVNRIINDTSAGKKINSYRKRVFKCLPKLEMGELVIRLKKNKKKHGYKENIELTEVGSEFAHLVNSINKFDEFYLQPRDKIEETFYLPDRSVKQERAKRKLQEERWKDQEINSYDELAGSAWVFASKSLNIFISAVKIRYVFIKSRYTLTDIAHDILLRTVTDTIYRYALIELENYEKELNIEFACSQCNEQLPVPPEAKNNQKSLLLSQDTSKLLFDWIDTSSPYILEHNRFISNEVKNIIRSLFSVFSSPREFVELHLKEGTSALEMRRKESELLSMKDKENNPYDGCDQVLNLYRELLN